MNEKKKEPEIVFDEEGMPMIVIPPTSFPTRNFEVHFIEFRPENNFTRLQNQKEINFFEKILKDLEDMFKG